MSLNQICAITVSKKKSQCAKPSTCSVALVAVPLECLKRLVQALSMLISRVSFVRCRDFKSIEYHLFNRDFKIYNATRATMQCEFQLENER